MMSVATERSAQSWTIVLDRADKMNALSAEVVESLIATVDEAIAARMAVLVFKGNGRNFSAGFDFGDLDAQSEADLLQRFIRIEMLLQRVACAPCHTVGFAHGRNFGAGVDLFAACRTRIAAPGATFRLPGLGFGIQLGTRRFASIVGHDVACAILGGLETFDAGRANAIGFVECIAAPDEWPAIVAGAESAATRLPAASRALLHRALNDGAHDADLADLVRSAAAPGLKDRIRSYLAAQGGSRTPT